MEEIDRQKVQGADGDVISQYIDSDFHLTLITIGGLHQKGGGMVERGGEGHNLARGEKVAARLAVVTPLSLPTLLPSSKWLDNVVDGAFSINTLTRHLAV